jgi:hypothetical protein
MRLICVISSIAVISGMLGPGRAFCATFVVTNTSDGGAGSLRQAILSANLSANVPDVISFNIAGPGPHTISPVTPLPAITDPLIIDGYSQPGASPNTLTNGDNAVLKLLILESLIVDTTNSTVRGLAIRQIQIGALPNQKGSNVVEGCFVGLDTSGTNSLASPGFGVFVQTPNNRVGGTNAGARNVISGKGATGIEIFEAFASNNVVQGNFIGTDRTGTMAIGNTDRALVVNMAASAATIGGEVPGAGNVISGNLNRGITLDGSDNIVRGNRIGTTVTGQPLGNARTGIEIGGARNFVGGTRSGAGNVIAFNGINGEGFTTNGVDVKPGATLYTILGNSIFDNAGLGIDVNANGLITPGFPLITLASNTITGTVIKGSNMPNVSFLLELFTNPTADPSGFGEGKTLLVSTNIATDAGGNFTINWPVPLAPGLFLTATANGDTEFSQARLVTAAGTINSWTNSLSGKWETGANWSLGVPPFSGHSLVLITNAATKTVNNDAATASGFPTTLTVSNLIIGAPTGATNTLLLAHGGTSTPLRILKTLNLSSGGAMVISNATVNLEGPPSSFSHLNGALTLQEGAFNATNSSQFYIGSTNSGSLTVSGGTFRAYYPIVGINPGGNGTWNIAGGTNIVTQVFDLGDSLTATGTVRLTDGILITPVIYIGLFGNGQLFVSNGIFQCTGTADIASQPGAQGTFATTGGFSIFQDIIVNEGPGATGVVQVAGNGVVVVDGTLDNRTGGTVRMDGGALVTSKLLVKGTAQFIFNQGLLRTESAAVSNNTVFVVGDGTNSAEYRLISGGTNVFARGLRIADHASLTGDGVIAGMVTNFGVIAPGDDFGDEGEIDIYGGLVLSNSSDLQFDIAGYGISDFLRTTGSVVLNGKLSVSLVDGFESVMTNGSSFIVMSNSTPFTGAFTNVANGGLLITTDGYARFTVLYAGRTLVLTNLMIMDSDGDGMPNWWEDRFNLDKSNRDDATQDADSDGASNLAEFLAGTEPNSSFSVFRIVSLRRETNNVRITWATVGGKSYRVQTNAPSAGGSITTNFADLSPLITVSGTGESTTNFLHTGGFTNIPARYYRIRLGP